MEGHKLHYIIVKTVLFKIFNVGAHGRIMLICLIIHIVKVAFDKIGVVYI